MLTIVDIRNTQSGVIVDVKNGGILPYSIPFSQFKHMPESLHALVEYALVNPEHDAFHMDELPRPEAEAQAAEASEINGWLGEAVADGQDFRDVKFGSKQWFDGIEEIPF